MAERLIAGRQQSAFGLPRATGKCLLRGGAAALALYLAAARDGRPMLFYELGRSSQSHEGIRFDQEIAGADW